MFTKKVIWLLAFCFLFGSFHSQNLSFNFSKLGTEEGLNSLNIFNIQQDELGLIHISTDNGVYVFNGYNFSLIKADSLKNPTIISSFVKNRSTTIFSTREYGITEFDHKKNSYNFITKEKLTGNIDQIIIDKNYVYLLASGIRLDIYDLRTNKLISDDIKSKNKNNQAYCLFQTKNGKILVGRSDGLYELNDAKQIKIDLLKNLPVYSLTENNAGELLVGSSSKIFFIKDNTLQKEIIPVYNKATTFSIGGEKSINKIVCDAYNRIWFTSYPTENIYVYDKGITHDVFAELNITPVLINCIYKDSKENIWIGTFDDGIYLIQNTFFNNVSINLDEKILGVNKIFFKNDYVFTATSNGFYGYDINQNVIKTISAPDNVLTEPVFDIKELNNILYFTKRSQFDLSPKIFMGGNTKYFFKPLLGKLIHPLENKQLVICDWQASILLTNENASKVIDTLISFPDFSFKINSIYSSHDSLLVATNKGIYLYDFKTKTHRLLSKNANNRINDISTINNEIIYAYEEGIAYLNKNKVIKTIGSKVLIDVKKVMQHQGKIWIVTSDGLFICDSVMNPIKVFNKSNGLLSNFVNDISFNEKYACISTSKGISIAQTEQLLNYNTTINSVSIDRIKINELNYDFDRKVIALKTSDNDVTVFFNSPYFTKPNKQFYKYKLDNSNWIPLENTAFNLPAIGGGLHTLAIIASADNINWSLPTKIEFNKEAKFSETKYSFLIIIVFAIIIVSLISYFIVKRIKTRALKRIQEEQQVTLLKHQAMNALLSPHFIFNSLTSIQNYINSNNSLKASEYLAKFSRLIRMIIEKAAQGEILLRDEITRLSYYLELEKERFKNKFDYKISIDESIDVNMISIPNMIIQPHAENCIIHGILPKLEHGHLNIDFKKTPEGKLLITIEDDGIGLIKAKEHSKTGHKSLGTATIKSILELNSKLTGKTQKVTMIDKSTINADKSGTIITIELEL